MSTRSYSVHRVARDERAYRDVVDTVRSAPNGEVADLERTIAAYEAKHGMSSVEAREALSRGELEPTREIEGWMMAVRLREHLASAKARAR